MKTLALAALASFTAAAASAATFNTFSDRTAFNAAAGPVKIEDFEGVTGEPDFVTSALTVGDITLLVTGDTTPVNNGWNAIDKSPFKLPGGGGTNATYDVNAPGDSSLVAVALRASDNDQLTLTFSENITAFGADFGEFNNGSFDTAIKLSGGNVTGEVDTNAPQPVDREIIFFGVVSDTPFSQILITAPSSDGDVFSFDNVAYTDTSVIPLPLPAALLIGGIAGLGLVRRRR